MKTKRLFIALPIDTQWEKIFTEYADSVKQISYLKWEENSKLHTTLLFLGTTNEELIPEIADALTDIALVQKPFTIVLDKITYAPPEGKQTMLWATWKTPPEFATLHARVKEELFYIVGDAENNPLLAHTTLARFDKKIEVPKTLIELPSTPRNVKDMLVSEVLLLESMVTKTGSTFKVLNRFKFEGTGESVDSLEEEEEFSL